MDSINRGAYLFAWLRLSSKYVDPDEVANILFDENNLHFNLPRNHVDVRRTMFQFTCAYDIRNQELRWGNSRKDPWADASTQRVAEVKMCEKQFYNNDVARRMHIDVVILISGSGRCA